MKIRPMLAFALATTLILSARLVLAADPIINQESEQTQEQEQVYGRKLMTQQERTDMRAKMRAATTAEEKAQIRKDHHQQMQQRAKEQGVSLVNKRPNKGRGRMLGSVNTTTRVNEFDQRQTLPLNQAQQAHVLKEMRKLLAGTQAIVAALADDDMEAVATQARLLGMEMKKKPENKLHGILPKAFMMQGKALHRAFDKIADDAAFVNDSKHTLRQLSETLNLCQGCHEMYRIEANNTNEVAGK